MDKLRFKDVNGEDYPQSKTVKYKTFLKIPRKEKPNSIDKGKILSVQLHRRGARFSENTDSLSIGSTTYYSRKSGQFIYGKQNFFNGAFDILGDHLDGGLSSGDVPSLDINEKVIDKTYFLNYISRASYYKNIEKFTSGTGSKRLHEEQLLDLTIRIPVLSEQEKIGGFLNSFNKLILKQQEKIDLLKELKKGYLQQMFPSKDSSIPKIRFKKFTDAWEQCKYGDMADYKKGPFGSALKKEIFVPKSKDSIKVYEQQNAINKNWTLERYFITKSYANELKAFETHSGDILVSCAGTIGEIYELPSNSEPGVINQALMRVRVNEKIVSKKLYKLLFSSMIDKFSKEHSNGSAMKNIPPFADLKPMIEMVPSIDEQDLIGEYFTQLDNLITLHQLKLKSLEDLKQGYMQRLFL